MSSSQRPSLFVSPVAAALKQEHACCTEQHSSHSQACSHLYKTAPNGFPFSFKTLKWMFSFACCTCKRKLFPRDYSAVVITSNEPSAGEQSGAPVRMRGGHCLTFSTSPRTCERTRSRSCRLQPSRTMASSSKEGTHRPGETKGDGENGQSMVWIQGK